MALFERRFLSRFVPDGDGYLFWVRGGAVRFEARDVDTLIAQRRRIVANPLLWGAAVVLGVVVPIWLIRQGDLLEALGFALAVTAIIAVAVCWSYAESLPDMAARTRGLEKLGGVPRPSFLALLINTMLIAFFSWRNLWPQIQHPDSAGVRVVSLLVSALFVGLVLWSFLSNWRNLRRWQAQRGGQA